MFDRITPIADVYTNRVTRGHLAIVEFHGWFLNHTTTKAIQIIIGTQNTMAAVIANDSMYLSYHRSYPHVNTLKNVSYPQVYPQINLTD